MSLSSDERVLHEHSHGHRSNSSRDRSDERGDLDSGLVVDISNETLTRFLGRVCKIEHQQLANGVATRRTGNEVGSNVDNNSSRLEPRTLDKERLSDCRDDDISLFDLYPSISFYRSIENEVAYDRLQVLSPRVTLSDGSILFTQKSANWRTDNIGSTEDDSVLSRDVDTSVGEEEHDSSGGAGSEKWGRRSGR